MMKYATKFVSEILPSVAATIIGAYIVNHYIANKPASEAPPAAAASIAVPGTDAKPVDTGTGSLPAHGVRAKGISEKVLQGSDRASVEQRPSDKNTEKADAPAESGATPPEPRRVQASRSNSKTASLPAAAAAAAPTATNVEPANQPDAAELARAAIERLRGPAEAARSEGSRSREATRGATETPKPETSKPEALKSVATATPMQPLPPPVTVSAPANADIASAAPPYTGAISADSSRLTPPAEIPMAPPLDLRAEATRKERTSVADDVVSAAKSVFHAVLPH